MKLFLQEVKKSCKDLVRKNCKIIFLQDMIKILQENNLVAIAIAIFLAISLQDYLFFARKALRLWCKTCKIATYVKDLMQDLASLARIILARFVLQDG